MLRTAFILVVFFAFALSLPINDNAHHVHKALPSTWFHPDNHPVHALFKRAPGDGVTYPPVGSPGPFIPLSKTSGLFMIDYLRMVKRISFRRIPHIPASKFLG
jgi:hypothetical protein